MARIVYAHPSRTRYPFHAFTDLDFWDARKILIDLIRKGNIRVKRNFGKHPSGDDFPTQIVSEEMSRHDVESVKKRIQKAIVSPPRHVIVRSFVMEERYEFDPAKYFPKHWSRRKIIRFLFHRLPMEQGVINSPYRTVEALWMGDRIVLRRVLRKRPHDPVIRNRREAIRRTMGPTCF